MKSSIHNLLLFALLWGVGLPATVSGATVRTITYQALVEHNGSPLRIGSLFRFSLFDVSNNGVPLETTDYMAGLPDAEGRVTLELEFDGSFFDGRDLWLEVRVSNSTLSPRQRITPTPYAMAVPGQSVDGGETVNLGHGFPRVKVGDGATATHFSVVEGRVGIGTDSPTAPLHVAGPGLPAGILESSHVLGTWLQLINTSPEGKNWSFISTGSDNGEGPGRFVLSNQSSGLAALVVAPNGNVGVGVTAPTEKLDVNGSLRLRGADIVEGFESSSGERVEPGTVVSIDASPDHEGALTPSSEAYDTRVAGVVSGAGGIPYGVSLGVEGRLDGDTKVAMTGRVYVKCTDEGGPIRAGDLLTTASLAGHAMKATDRDRAPGSVIGKALGSLDDATGLVLVLVNLQ